MERVQIRPFSQSRSDQLLVRETRAMQAVEKCSCSGGERQVVSCPSQRYDVVCVAANNSILDQFLEIELKVE